MMITAGQQNHFDGESLLNELCQRFPEVSKDRVRTIVIQCNVNRQRCIEALGREIEQLLTSPVKNMRIADGFAVAGEFVNQSGSNDSLSGASGDTSPGVRTTPLNQSSVMNNSVNEMVSPHPQMYNYVPDESIFRNQSRLIRESHSLYQDNQPYVFEQSRPNRPNTFTSGLTNPPFIGTGQAGGAASASPANHPYSSGSSTPNRHHNTSTSSNQEFDNMASPNQAWRPPFVPPSPHSSPSQMYSSRLFIERLSSPVQVNPTGFGQNVMYPPPSQHQSFFATNQGTMQILQQPQYANQQLQHSSFNLASGDGRTSYPLQQGVPAQNVFNNSMREQNFAQGPVNSWQPYAIGLQALGNQSGYPFSSIVSEGAARPVSSLPPEQQVSKAPEDSTYIQTLLQHQQQRMAKLQKDLQESKAMKNKLQQEVGDMERHARERRDSKSGLTNINMSTAELRKMKQENRKLQIDIQLLTREIDLFNNGQTPLGVLDTHQLQSFYHNLDSGRQGSSNASGGSSKPTTPPPRPPPPRLGSKDGRSSSVPTILVTPPAVVHNIPGFSTCSPQVPEQAALQDIPDPRDEFAVVSEMDDDDSLKWGCSQCTFLNHELIKQCEMCDHPRM